ncbi:AAA family ATPase [Cellulosilyticum sp. I15G10I2]|uniref:AAA family ATPase n=1 Tax=Cellulosilyticum sp. I15G10I2 TaxID=1892843 RepID=UPI00085CD38D|nr:AAA family ATPase [Cellulosilyticum sp. I15G10I2]
MINRIHILGASGSGTTTLGKALSEKLNYVHLDTDDYYWKPTNPPFQEKTICEERQETLKRDLLNNKKWILSGSLCGWGDIFIPYFDLVIFLWIPNELRMNRLMERERRRYEEKIEPSGELYKQHIEFIDWASQYDDGDLNIRSRILHEKWLHELSCKVIRLEGVFELEEKLDKVLEFIEAESNHGLGIPIG